ARKENSPAATATRRPSSRPSPVSTASSTPLRSRARASWAAYSGPRSGCSGSVSQETKLPSSRTAVSTSRALSRATSALLQPGADGGPVLVEQRRAGVLGRGGLGAVGGEEAQRRPGQLDRPEGGVVDVDEQALGAGL